MFSLVVMFAGANQSALFILLRLLASTSGLGPMKNLTNFTISWSIWSDFTQYIVQIRLKLQYTICSWLFLCEINAWQGLGKRKIEFYYPESANLRSKLQNKQRWLGYHRPPDLGFDKSVTHHRNLNSYRLQ